MNHLTILEVLRTRRPQKKDENAVCVSRFILCSHEQRKSPYLAITTID